MKTRSSFRMRRRAARHEPRCPSTRSDKKGVPMVPGRCLVRFGKILIDAALLGLAFSLAFVARFEGSLPTPFTEILLLYLPWIVATKLVVLAAGGRLKPTWCHTNLNDVIQLVSWLALTTLLLMSWLQIKDR